MCCNNKNKIPTNLKELGEMLIEQKDNYILVEIEQIGDEPEIVDKHYMDRTDTKLIITLKKINYD